MPLYYLDSSALAKQYRVETGSLWVRNLTQTQPVAVSTLIIVEVSSAMARLVREGVLTPRQRGLYLQRFVLDVEAMFVVGLERDVIEDAAALVVQSPTTIPLRSLDALHLATARKLLPTASNATAQGLTFVSADTRLLAAAQWAGFATDDPNDHP
jgi:predicted nucleic acid-binding protein